MTLLWQKLSILLQNENFKMMSRRFKLSHELSNIKDSTLDGIPEIEQDHSNSSQSIHNLDTLDQFLKERLEESNLISENFTSTSESSQNYLNTVRFMRF